ncbi:pde-4 [Symbiodinium natans]|uniref:Phosphodiesterase n=1 Tax=Symbiodinium natans TaxID=878477 RepID=A0A812IKZ6_9DINO|nr:pde-4 [Symbiodinium natans]
MSSVDVEPSSNVTETVVVSCKALVVAESGKKNGKITILLLAAGLNFGTLLLTMILMWLISRSKRGHKVLVPKKDGRLGLPHEWIRDAFRIEVEDMDVIPIDGQMVIRLCQLGLKFAAFGTLVSCVLTPIYAKAGGGQSGILALTMSNLSTSDEQYVFAIVVAAAYFLVFFFIWLVRAEWRHFLKLRQDHFLRRAKGLEGLTSAQAQYSLLVQRLPRKYQDSKALEQLFSGLFPDRVHSAVSQRDTLLYYHLRALKKTSDNLMVCTCCQGCVHRQLERTVQFERRIARSYRETENALQGFALDGQVDEALSLVPLPFEKGSKGKAKKPDWRPSLRRSTNLTDEHQNAPTSTGFVTLNSLSDRVLAEQVTLFDHPELQNVEVEPAPEADAIIWENVQIPYDTVTRRMWLGRLLCGLGLLFWSPLITSIQVISSVQTLKMKLPEDWFTYMENHFQVGYSMLVGYLPVIALLVLLLILPCALEFISVVIEGRRSKIEVALSVSGRNFWFQFFSLWLTVFSSSLSSSVQEILEHPACIASILGSSIPQVSVYFTTFVIARIGISLPLLLLRMDAVMSLLFPQRSSDAAGGGSGSDTDEESAPASRSLAESSEAEDPEKDVAADTPVYCYFVSEVTNITIVFVLALMYCVVAPLMMPACLIYFGLAFVVYKWLFVHVYSKQFDLMGELWYSTFWGLIVGVAFGVISLAGLAAVYRGPRCPEFFALWTLAFIIAIFAINCENNFKRKSEVLSFQAAVHANASAEAQSMSFNRSCYVDPILQDLTAQELKEIDEHLEDSGSEGEPESPEATGACGFSAPREPSVDRSALLDDQGKSESGWPPLGRLLPLIILAMPGSWAIAVPMTSLKAHEPMGKVLSTAAVLPPAWTGQLLVRTATGAEFPEACKADFYAILAGIFQFALLAAVSAWRLPTAKFPLPLVLGAVQGLGHLVGVAMIPLIMEIHMHEIMVFESFVLPLVAFLLVGASAQLTWGVRFQLDETASTLAALRRLQQVNRKHRGQDSDNRKGPLVVNHYEETIHQVEAVMDALSKRPKLSKEVVGEFWEALHSIKGTLTSGKLFKTEVMEPLIPPSPGSCPVMVTLSDSSLREQLRQVRSMVDNEPVEHIKPRLSTQSDQSESLLPDELPGSVADTLKKQRSGASKPRSSRSGPGRSRSGPGHSRSARSSGSGAMRVDDQLSFLAQLHKGRFNECLEEDEMPEPMNKKETAFLQLGRWKFDSYAFDEQHGNALLHAGFTAGAEFLAEAEVANFQMVLRGFLQDVQRQYRDVPYHNYIHAVDVLSSTMYFMFEDRRVSRLPLSSIPRLAAFVAAVIHDVGHFGRSNRYHIASHDPVAILFNDQSPLENMHCTIGFSILQQPNAALFKRKSCISEDPDGCNECTGLPDADFALLRRIVVESVLSTDMSKHFETLARFKASINFCESADQSRSNEEAPIFAESSADRSARVVSIYLKAADIGHAGKPTDITKRMTIRIHMEFFAQGEEERQLGLPISPLCDRSEVNIPTSQVGFLRHLVIPLYQAVHFYITSDDLLSDCLNQLEANLSNWQSPTPCVTNQDVPQVISDDEGGHGAESCAVSSFGVGVFPQEQIVKLINGSNA